MKDLHSTLLSLRHQQKTAMVANVHACACAKTCAFPITITCVHIFLYVQKLEGFGPPQAGLKTQ